MPSIATLNQLRDRLEIGDPSEDLFLQELLDRATGKINSILGRRVEIIEGGTHVEYLSGNGKRMWYLQHGPVPLVTSPNVFSTEYDSSGNESNTTLTANVDYHVYDVRGNGDRGRTSLEHIGAGWNAGVRNFKCSYTAGWNVTTTTPVPDIMPAELTEACLYASIWMRQKRKDTAKDTRNVGSSVAAFRGEGDLDMDLRRMLSSFLSHGSL